jgi:hypothetical protein
MSNAQLAKYTGISEATLRRHLKNGIDRPPRGSIRQVVRAGRSYLMETARIGSASRQIKRKRERSSLELERDFSYIRHNTQSPEVRRYLNVLDKWLSAGLAAPECVIKLNNIDNR